MESVGLLFYEDAPSLSPVALPQQGYLYILYIMNNTVTHYVAKQRNQLRDKSCVITLYCALLFYSSSFVLVRGRYTRVLAPGTRSLAHSSITIGGAPPMIVDHHCPPPSPPHAPPTHHWQLRRDLELREHLARVGAAQCPGQPF